MTLIFFNKLEEMYLFFKERGYPDSVDSTGQQRAQQIKLSQHYKRH